MRKTVLVLFMAILGSTTIMNAQESWNFGVKGGANFSTVTGDYFDSPSSRTAYHLGLLAEIPLTDRFSLQPEVLYSAQGYDFAAIDEDNIFDNDDNIEYQADYISVPILAEIYVIDGLSFQIGPSFNFKVNEELDYQPLEDGGDVDLDRFDDFEMNGALGVEYKFNNGFFLNGRYNHGFSEVFEGSDARTSLFQAGVGFMF